MSNSPAETRSGLFPALLRHWRTRQGLSQLDLALVAGVSSRHVSFLETGRSAPSMAMVLRLAASLDIPLRDVNVMLRAAGHEPRYPEPSPGDGLPTSVRTALEVMKGHHDPFPLIVVDRSYRVVDVNQGAMALLGMLLPEAAAAGSAAVNLATFTFDPVGGRRVIANFAAVGRELLWRLQREVLADPGNRHLREVLDEVLSMDSIESDWRQPDPTTPSTPTLELQLRVGAEIWTFLLMVTAIQAPMEVAVDELRIESWFPVDEVTARGCAELVAAAQAQDE